MSEYKAIDNVTLHSTQPLATFIEIYVAGHLLRSEYSDRREKSRAPEYIQSLEFQRINTAGNIIFTVFDKNWTELETVFNLGNQHVDIRYGYVTGKQSALISCILGKYNVKFTMNGTIITVQAMSTSVHKNLDLVSVKTGSSNPSEAAKSLCQAAGFQIGTFEETLDVDLPGGFSALKEHPVSYINQRIAPYAMRKADGLGGYRLLLDDTTNPPTAHFMPLSAQAKADHVYIYGKGINSSVISLDIDVNGVFGGTGINGATTNIEAGNIDATTEDSTTINSNTEAAAAAATNTTEEAVYTDTPGTQQDIISTDGLTTEQAIAAVNSAVSLSGSIPYSGTIVILGDPTINVSDTIELKVLKTNGDVYEAISGKYLVTGVQDSITNGKYTTSIKVVKDIGGSGSNLLGSNASGGSSGQEEDSASGENSSNKKTTKSTTTKKTTSTSETSVSNNKGSKTSSYAPNSKISKVAVRIYVPKSGVGHYELVVTGGTSVYKKRKYDRLVLSFGSNGNVNAFPNSKTPSRSGTKYYWDVKVKNFDKMIKTLESFTPGSEKYSKGVFSYKSRVNYRINKYNCFWFVAQALRQMGNNTLWNIYSKAKSYKDYTAIPMYKKYGKAWRK